MTGTIENAVFAWNEAPAGAALLVTDGLGLTVRNSVFLENGGGAAITQVAGYWPTVVYNDFAGNTLDVWGLWWVVGWNGNVSASPGFVDAEGGDFTLEGGSALLDAGDPTVQDVDGSRSDIGRFGGPAAF